MRRSRAFTMVEILITALVLSVFLILLWEFVSRGSSSGVVNIWRQSGLRELQNLAGLIRKDIQRSSFPSAITPERVIVASREEYFLRIGSGGTPELPDWEGDEWEGYKVVAVGPGKDGDAVERELFSVVQSTPGKSGIPGFPEQPVRAKRIRYVLRGGREVYGKSARGRWVQELYRIVEEAEEEAESFREDTSLSFRETSCRLVAHDVNLVLIGVPEDYESSMASGGDSVSIPVRVKILMLEPSSGKAAVSVAVTSQTNVGVAFE